MISKYRHCITRELVAARVEQAWEAVINETRDYLETGRHFSNIASPKKKELAVWQDVLLRIDDGEDPLIAVMSR